MADQIATWVSGMRQQDWARLVLWLAPPEWVDRWQRGELELPTEWLDLDEETAGINRLALGGAKVMYRAVSPIGLEVRVTPAAYTKQISVEIGFKNPEDGSAP